MSPLTGLSIGRIVLGSTALVSPALAAKMLLLDGKANPQLPLMTRMFGSREIALGALTLVSTGEARERMVQAGVAVDAADVLAGLSGLVRGSVPKLTAVAFTAVAAGAVATGVRALQD